MSENNVRDKTYSWLDVATKFVDVCYSCSSQNIDTSNNEKYVCKDCKSEDVGSVPPDEIL